MATKRYRKTNKKDYITFEDLEQYGLGSWLRKNAGPIGTVAGIGAGIGITALTGGAGATLLPTMISAGSAIGGSVGGAIQSDAQMQEATAAQNKIIESQGKLSSAESELQNKLNQKNTQTFAPTMESGGNIPKKYYINTSGTKREIPESEVADVRKYLAYQKRLNDSYNSKYKTRISNLSKKGINTPEAYDKYIKEHPENIVPSEDYESLYKGSKFTPEEVAEYEPLRDRYFSVGQVRGTKEDFKDRITSTAFGGRNYFADLNLGLEELVQNPEPIDTTPYSYEPLRGYPNVQIGYTMGKTGGTRTPSVFRNAAGQEVAIDPKKGLIPESYPELTKEMQYAQPKKPLSQMRFKHGGTINYNGQYHEGPNGGVPVDEMGNPNYNNPVALVEKGEVGYNTKDGGTYIFSDTLLHDKNKTFASRAKRIQGKYGMRLKDGKVEDSISKRGYELEMDNLMNQQEELRDAMELMEEDKMAKNREYGGNLPMYWAGGTGLKDEPKGSYGWTLDQNPSGFLVKPETSTAYEDLNAMLKADSASFKRTLELRNKYPEVANWKAPKVNAGSTQQIRKDLGAKNNFEPLAPHQGMSITEAALPAVASGLSNLWLANRAKRYTPRRLSLAPTVAKTINLEPERAALREQGDVARAMNKRALLESGANPAQYAANVNAGNIGVQRALGEQLGRSYTTEELTNLEAKQRADEINAQNAREESIYNAQVDAAKKAQVDQYYMNALSTIPMAAKDYYQSQKDAELLNMMQPNYKMYTTRKNRYWGLGGNKYKVAND